MTDDLDDKAKSQAAIDAFQDKLAKGESTFGMVIDGPLSINIREAGLVDVRCLFLQGPQYLSSIPMTLHLTPRAATELLSVLQHAVEARKKMGWKPPEGGTPTVQ